MLKRAFSVLFALLLLLGCKTDITAKKVTQAPVIDGDPSDWPGNVIIYTDEGLIFGAAYDEDYLYLTVSSSKASTLRSIMRNGVNLWINTKGKTRKTFGIQFPRPMDPETMRMMGGTGRRMDQRNADNSMNGEDLNRILSDQILMQREFALMKDDKRIAALYPLEPIQHIKIASSMFNGRFNYEIAVPFSDGGEEGTVKYTDRKTIRIGLEIPVPDMPAAMGNSMRGGGGGGGMSSGMDGGMMPGSGGGKGGGMQPGGGRPSEMQPTEIWIKVLMDRE